MSKEWSTKLKIWKIFYLIFLYFLILSRLISVIIYDNNGLYMKSTVPGYSNIGWMFTQFTWWTTILLAVLETIKLILASLGKSLNAKNPFIRFLMSENVAIWIVSYIMVVSVLFFVGAAEIIFFNKDKHVIKPFVPTSLLLLDKIITIVVHAIHPIIVIIGFVLLSKHGYVQKADLKETIIFGMLYPLIYIVFYTVFALIYYDPYVVTNLKKAKGIWLLPIVLASFAVSIIGVYYIAHRYYLLINKNK